MPQLGDLTGPGFLCITGQPKPGWVDEYNDWYDSEYGPLRMKLDFIVNGYRYRSTEDPSMQLATYDLKKISGVTEPSYTTLLETPSQREQELLSHKLNLFDQRIYTPISTRGHLTTPAPIMMSVAFVVEDRHVDELHRWYEQEHTHDLQQIPGWLRSRRFQLVHGSDQRPGHTELLAVHEYAAENGLDGPEHELAKSKPWRNRVLGLVASRKNQRYEFVHEVMASDYKKPAKAVSSQNSEKIPSNMPNGISHQVSYSSNSSHVALYCISLLHGRVELIEHQ